MKKMIFLWLLLSFSLFLSGCDEQSHIEKIVFVRHAEKPTLPTTLPFPYCSLGQLTCQGLNRALALPRVLNQKFGRPDYIFAPDPFGQISDGCSNSGVTDLNYYVRPLATIEPTAIQYNFPVNTLFQFTQVSELANYLITPKYQDSLIFVAWEHERIVLIAQQIVTLLGGNPNIIPQWDDNDFDSIYVLTIDWNKAKNKVKFTHNYEGLNNQSASCPSAEGLTATVKNNSLAQVQTIYLIPAGETSGNGQLNCVGLNRAIGLQSVLTPPNIPNAIQWFFAPDPTQVMYPTGTGSFYYQRGLMTLEPTAVAQSPEQAMWTPYGYTQSAEMAAFINTPTYQDQVIAIAWDISQLKNLATAIYANAGGDIHDIDITNSYDNFYEIVITRNGPVTTTTFTKRQENIPANNICPLSVKS